jgi:hypothetical protein
MLEGRYLIDKEGTEYRFNADMAKHTDLYAVMEGGRRIPYKGSPNVNPNADRSSEVLTGDRMPTEEELLAAKALIQKYEGSIGDSIVMQAQAAQAARVSQQQQQATAEAAMGPSAPEQPHPFPTRVVLADNPDAVVADLVPGAYGQTEPGAEFDPQGQTPASPPDAPPVPKASASNKRLPPPPPPGR